MSGRRVVIGVGNAYRGDDAVGLAVAERVRGVVDEDVEVLECEQEPTRLLDAWSEADLAVVVDACAAGGAPGSVHRFDVSDGPLPARVFRSSTHAFGVGDAVELSRALRQLPKRIVVYGVEGADFAAGAQLSASVESAVDRVVGAIVRDLEPGGHDA
ncbi:MAG TPA: hydrogenase maturation protease [Gaiella sp.]|jgi:hydrogenase maturation protease|nr:hydrogenase maturation protease [Gaiella sp.]